MKKTRCTLTAVGRSLSQALVALCLAAGTSASAQNPAAQTAAAQSLAPQSSTSQIPAPRISAAPISASQIPASQSAAKGTVRFTPSRASIGVDAAGANPEPGQGATQAVSLALGEIVMLPMRGKVRRIAVGNGASVSATTVDASLMLIGEQVGTTTLVVWTDRGVTTYRVRVLAADLATTRRVIEGVLKGAGGVSIDEYDSKLVVSGSVPRALHEQLTAAVKDTAGVTLNLRIEEGGPLVRSVLFRLHFVEVNKSLLERIGVQWAAEADGPTIAVQGVAVRDGIYRNLPPAASGGDLLAPGFVSRNARNAGIFFGLATSIASRIHLGVSEGEARILASPELTAKSGGKARLQVGGEIPIPSAGAFGSQSVEFKPYGILFSIEPVIDSSGTITAKLSTELSQIDPSVRVNGIPGFLTRSTSTEISVKSGEMIALSGLVNGELSNAIDQVPGLGSVPILGRLFRSDDFRRRRTDLVLLLEPEIISAGDGLAANVRQRGVDNRRDFEEQSARKAPLAGPRPAAAADASGR